MRLSHDFAAYPVAHDFPAYDVVTPIDAPLRGMPVLFAGDELALLDAPMQHYQMGSVASYALDYGDCPLEAVERAKGLGHALYWAFALGTSITSHKRPKGRYIGIECGKQYWFEGRVITFKPAANRNVAVVVIR